MDEKQIKEACEQILGVSDVARILNWSNNKVSVYKDRTSFPDPIDDIGGRPVWWIKHIEAYKAKKEQEN